jgi:hypothetical protein
VSGALSGTFPTQFGWVVSGHDSTYATTKAGAEILHILDWVGKVGIHASRHFLVADRCREGCREGCREYFRRSLGGGRDVGRDVGNIPDAVWVAGGMIAFALGASVPLIGAH